MQKTYLAIAAGVPPLQQFVVDAPILRHSSIKCALAHSHHQA